MFSEHMIRICFRYYKTAERSGICFESWQRPVCLFEFEARLVYMESSRPGPHNEISHTMNAWHDGLIGNTAAKPNDPSLIPETHIVEREKLLQIVP